MITNSNSQLRGPQRVSNASRLQDPAQAGTSETVSTGAVQGLNPGVSQHLRQTVYTDEAASPRAPDQAALQGDQVPLQRTRRGGYDHYRVNPSSGALPASVHRVMDEAEQVYDEARVIILPGRQAVGQVQEIIDQANRATHLVTDVQSETNEATRLTNEAMTLSSQRGSSQRIWPAIHAARHNIDLAREHMTQARAYMDQARVRIQPARGVVDQALEGLAAPAEQARHEQALTDIQRVLQDIDHEINNAPINWDLSGLRAGRHPLRQARDNLIALQPTLTDARARLQETDDRLTVLQRELADAEEVLRTNEQNLQRVLQTLESTQDRGAGPGPGGSGSGSGSGRMDAPSGGSLPKKPRIDAGRQEPGAGAEPSSRGAGSSQSDSVLESSYGRRIHGSTSEDPAGEFAAPSPSGRAEQVDHLLDEGVAGFEPVQRQRLRSALLRTLDDQHGQILVDNIDSAIQDGRIRFNLMSSLQKSGMNVMDAGDHHAWMNIDFPSGDVEHNSDLLRGLLQQALDISSGIEIVPMSR
ncbi:hypothetical protein [Burkholderia singularis]|uniref:hypothetical protein n=1 Tax=Burkholderia singularis TaxID=1503053 RepID=UPI000AB1A84D|nr:hypothetical protein [Burkholderia singularis]